MKMYITIPVKVAASVPIGIDFLGSFRSPDKPTPAVIPVKAGKQIAKTLKKESPPSTLLFSRDILKSGAVSGLPKKKASKARPKITTTKYKAFIPISAPLVSINAISKPSAGNVISLLL